MPFKTYRELFQAALEEWIEDGGEVSRMVTLVNIYQGRDPTARELEFREWLDWALFFCEHCARAFAPDADEVDEEAYVLCSRKSC